MSIVRPATLAAFLLAAASTASAQITLYEHDNFNGREVRSGYSISNLADNDFNDMASSARVRNGRWQLCEHAYFGGRCVTIGPGEYPSLGSMGLNDQVSSVRELGWTPNGNGGWSGNDRYNSDAGYNNKYTYNGNNWGGGDWGSASRAVLFASYNLSGEAFVVGPGGVRNLDRVGFNDKARSLRIESGYWIFCTDADFQGECHTYGPGDYASLPNGQDHKISSGRRVSSNYPYRNNPNWNGY